jgi:hypothetical protein
VLLTFAVPSTSLSNQTNTQSTAAGKALLCLSPAGVKVLLFLLPALSASRAKMLGQNHFAETCFDFSSFNFLWQGHPHTECEWRYS